MIHILTTGGTIEGLDYTDEKNKSLENTVGIEDFLKTANISFDYTLDNAFSKDSRFITDKDRNLLLQKIKSKKSPKRGF